MGRLIPKVSQPPPRDLRGSFFGQKKDGVSANQTGLVRNAADLAQLVYAGYNAGQWGPISVIKATLRQGQKSEPVTVLTISGTELVRDRRTGLPQATQINTGRRASFEMENEALSNAREVLAASVPAGSKLILTGHSLGGMVAQQLAADDYVRQNYEVLHTVAFGAPLLKLGWREGEVRRIATFGDPIPRISVESTAFLRPTAAGLVSALWSIFGQQNIPSRYTNNSIFRGFDAHIHDYTDELNPKNQEMDAIGRINAEQPAEIEFRLAERQFFSSPEEEGK